MFQQLPSMSSNVSKKSYVRHTCTGKQISRTGIVRTCPYVAMGLDSNLKNYPVFRRIGVKVLSKILLFNISHTRLDLYTRTFSISSIWKKKKLARFERQIFQKVHWLSNRRAIRTANSKKCM